ncbi:MAG: AAA family ATPase [Methylobacter sp.]
MAEHTDEEKVREILNQRRFKSTILNKQEIVDRISQKIVGHTTEIDMIVDQIRNGLASNPQKREGPIGVFMFLGPPGTGKTTLAKVVAEALYGEDSGFVAVDMNSCRDKHAAWTYFGSPMGYHGGPGSLTQAIQANKEKGIVVLLDEFEKADSEVHRMFLNAWATGFITDNRTGPVTTKNTIWMLTSNAATDLILNAKKGNKNRDDFNEACTRILENTGLSAGGGFAPEVLNRVNEFFCLEAPKEEQQINIITKIFENLAGLYDLKLAGAEYTSHAIEPNLVVETIDKLNSMEKGGIRALKRWISRQVSSQLVDAKASAATQVTFSSNDNHIKVTYYP